MRPSSFAVCFCHSVSHSYKALSRAASINPEACCLVHGRSEDDNGAESQDESHGARRSSPASKGTDETDISEVRVQENQWEIFTDIRVILENWVKNGYLTRACFDYIDFLPEYRRSNGELEWQWTEMEAFLTNKERVANPQRFQVYGTIKC